MPELPESSPAPLVARLRDIPGLVALVAEAEAIWRSRGGGSEGGPGWRAFEDAFPTFYEFTNRPR